MNCTVWCPEAGVEEVGAVRLTTNSPREAAQLFWALRAPEDFVIEVTTLVSEEDAPPTSWVVEQRAEPVYIAVWVPQL